MAGKYLLECGSASDDYIWKGGVELFMQVKKIEQPLILLVLGGGKNGHSIALYKTNTEIRIFDPNFGEFWFHQKNFSGFIDKIIEIYYGKYNFVSFMLIDWLESDWSKAQEM
ncbi:YopT-type cysteine protease domain-containing protein [Pelagibaculum spongiae]|uniref:Peptidase C58 YopT-type domain-containing protein n=1 Tax=Pelagibaculum spongiae TaxID=2080658 RepID=A0A2V1GXI4_9GAMM|nr:YopT-type cysteine protease domain-containing protein [Pelagibaculum spongiae]PVZ69708.1 hypothetical protein DC094_10430 [Pelagibaculum spongiae]